MKQAECGESPCDDVWRIITERIRENEERLARLQKVQKRMEAACCAWKQKSDTPPDRRHICRLIDSLDCD